MNDYSYVYIIIFLKNVKKNKPILQKCIMEIYVMVKNSQPLSRHPKSGAAKKRLSLQCSYSTADWKIYTKCC